MRTIMLKACMRCSGDMKVGNDHEIGLFAQCLQCGYVVYASNLRVAGVKAA